MDNQMLSNEDCLIGVKGLTRRERSFVRSVSNQNKRRSLAFQSANAMQHDSVHQQQMRSKPAIEIYRPPNIRSDGTTQNKLNVNAPVFTVNRDMQSIEPHAYFTPNAQFIQHSKSSGNIQQQIQLAATRRHAAQSSKLDGIRSETSCNSAVQFNSVPKVRFVMQQTDNQQPDIISCNVSNTPSTLQRSKSMSSADDTLARGVTGLGLGCANESNEIGTFKPEIQAIVDQALIDPNALNARSLMILANQMMQRAVEGRRFALPASRFCIAIIAKEKKETFLEALINNCIGWYQERDKVLGSPQKIRNSVRPRFTAFMAFLTEMFGQLKRRQLQLRTKCDGVSPPIVLLTVLSKCCEDTVKPPIRSLSEIECLFYVLTCVGRDIETHLPQHLEILLSMVRDAFLNSSASAPTIRRTLLQLIELQASQWQLAGNTVLYYYPTSK